MLAKDTTHHQRPNDVEVSKLNSPYAFNNEQNSYNSTNYK